ncbi:MAG: cell division protein ZipA C-terminal FtsZ-binding domain-containing protein [Burkholderiales bacterium]
MSELQIGLLGIGVLVVVLVISFNKWQEYRYRRLAEKSLHPQEVDALFRPEESGPIPANDVASACGHVEEGSQADMRAEPTIVDVESAETLALTAPSVFSAKIDLVAIIESDSGITQADCELASASMSWADRVGFEAWSEGIWEKPGDGVGYSKYRIGIQLVNRRGAVSDDELRQFSYWVAEISRNRGGTAVSLDLKSAIELATELDKFCGEVDLLIAVHIAATSAPFPGTKIRAIAEAAGLTIEGDGIFRKRDDEGRELFRLSNEGDTAFRAEQMRDLLSHSLVLEFDVARAPGTNHTFGKFRQFAQHLASGIGGNIVDDNKVLLDNAGFDAIGKKIASVQQLMASRGIVAGSPESLRLFS